MYFCISKLVFDFDVRLQPDDRELKALAEKIRKRFKVVAKPVALTDSGEIAMALAGLDRSQERLSRTLDEISELCEQAGLGRIDREICLMDHFDNIEDYEPFG
jgi:hypothetical protein